MHFTLKELHMGMQELYANASAGNLPSSRVIEHCGGQFLEEHQGSRYYRINL